SRAAVAWVGLIWLLPVVGPLLYILLGVNHLHRRAVRGRRAQPSPVAEGQPCPPGVLARAVGPGAEHLETLARLVGVVSGRRLLPGNRLRRLVNGDEAYPVMLEALEGARESVALSTYIFDNDPVGEQFLGGLRRAVARGVEVRVLVDDVGARYSWPSVLGRLR